MQSSFKNPSVALTALFLVLSISVPAQAHLMVAQHGTLNIVNGSAFMVLSLPVSAFVGIDENNDGKASLIEVNKHRVAIVDLVRDNIILSDENGNRPLQGITLSPVISHQATAAKATASQLVVMGRFTLDDIDSALRFKVGVYGKLPADQLLKISATRRSDNQKQVFELTPRASSGALFPTEKQEK